MAGNTAKTVLMVRPFAFGFNSETSVDNHFQVELDLPAEEATKRAQNEFDSLVDKLRSKNIEVLVFQDDAYPPTPDAVFPNNWVSFHEDGRIALFPLKSPIRRGERREEIFEILSDDFNFEVKEIEDFTAFEDEGLFLEGTGSMVLDREHRIAYAAISQRTDIHVLETFADRFDYEYVAFSAYHSVNGKRLPVYHTNVMMCLGSSFSVICLNSIDDAKEREDVLKTVKQSGKKIVEITEEQRDRFAGNMLTLKNKEGKEFCVMSSSAYNSLRPDQVQAIEKHAEIIYSPLDTIEALGGGSARCMMAEIFLPKRN